MSYKAEQTSPKVSNNNFTEYLHNYKFAKWVLSEYQDEEQLLSFRELNNYLTFVEGKVLKSKNSLFIVKSILYIYRKQLAISNEDEQKLAIVILSFVEKAQQEQLKKISNPHAIASNVVKWSTGDPSVANTIFRALLQSETLIHSEYLKNLTLWLTSKEQDLSLLLTGKKLQLALNKANFNLSAIESSFLVRSLVFNLRVS